jgi:serine/threonine protein kinase/predicted TPR repeat methyltransferase
MGVLPQKIGKYQIDSLLGKGGMGEVYKAHDVALGRFVALKVMRGPALDDTNARERFVREAQAAGGLRHPNIVTVYDLGEFEDRMFIAMEFIHGEDLEHLIRKKSRLSIDDKFNIMIQVCEGVSYAHKHQIIHRDLKPSNIRIDEQGIAKIMDFGIAKLESSNMTASGTVMGTPFYMSPEQVRGMRVDQRSDVFSLGAILYELFSYKKAFEGELATVFFKIVQEQPSPLTMSLPCEPLQEIINGCLEKDKNKRVGSVDELIAMLNKALQWYTERGMLAATGLEDDDQANIATFHIAPAPAAVKPKTSTHPQLTQQPPLPGSSSAPTQWLNQTVPPPVESSAPTELLQNRQPQVMPPPIPQPSSATPMTVVETVPRPASSKAPWIIVAVLAVALVGSILVYFLAFRHSPQPPIVQNPEPKKESPSNPNPQNSALNDEMAKGKELHQQGRYEEAIKVYSDALVKNPNDSDLHFLMGASKKSLGKSQEALLEFQRAVELDDRNQKAWEQIGDLLMNRMDYNGAEKAFLKSSELDPSAAPTWEGLAQTYLIQQKSAQAEESYEKLLQIEPNNVTAIYNLGLLQNGSNKKDAARKSFEKVISLNPNYAEAYNNLGAIDLYDGKVPQAIQELEQALSLKPELGSAHYSLFLAYEMQKNYPQAARHLKKYLELTGDDDPALKKKLEQYSH